MKRLLLALAAALALTAAASAADATPKTFNVPSADAAVSLQQFSDQSGEQIVYPADAVRGVTTNAVSGQFTARDALERMLAGTPLFVVEDERTGALAVKRRASDAPADPAPAASQTAAVGDDTVRLNEYVVTGSNIPTAADAT